MRPITALISSVPENEHALEKAIASLLPQVEFITVSLNNYKHVPPFLQHEKIQLHLLKNEYGEGGKFFKADVNLGFIISCSDRYIYPPDFAERITGRLKDFEYNVVLSCSGVILDSRPMNSFYSAKLQRFNATTAIKEDVELHIPGTEAMAYHSGFVSFTHQNIISPDPDVCMGLYARQREIKCIGIKHEADWLEQILLGRRQSSAADRSITTLINKYF